MKTYKVKEFVFEFDTKTDIINIWLGEDLDERENIAQFNIYYLKSVITGLNLVLDNNHDIIQLLELKDNTIKEILNKTDKYYLPNLMQMNTEELKTILKSL